MPTTSDRLKAYEKALTLSKLFEPDNYNKAMDLLNKTNDDGKEDFKKLCKEKLGDNPKEYESLWKGLKTKIKEQQDSGGAYTGW